MARGDSATRPDLPRKITDGRRQSGEVTDVDEVETLKAEADAARTRLANLRKMGPQYADLLEQAALNARAALRRYIDALTAQMVAEMKADAKKD